MQEAVGNIWNSGAQYICVTTNGIVMRNGELVMGKGIALDAKNRMPLLPKILGKHVKAKGNVPCIVNLGASFVVSFPTKEHFMKPSIPELIIKSATILAKNLPANATVALTRPGCGSGNLRWNDVRELLKPILDDRFTVYSY